LRRVMRYGVQKARLQAAYLPQYRKWLETEEGASLLLWKDQNCAREISLQVLICQQAKHAKLHAAMQRYRLHGGRDDISSGTGCSHTCGTQHHVSLRPS
jgi:hypothetical protein